VLINHAARLHEAIAAVCPIAGLSIGRMGDGESVVVEFAPDATAERRSAAAAALTGFDWSDAAHQAWQDDRIPERRDLRRSAAKAVEDLDTFLSQANPTAAQVAAQVKRQAQVLRALVRRVSQID
jgi:hypothetical protein